MKILLKIKTIAEKVATSSIATTIKNCFCRLLKSKEKRKKKHLEQTSSTKKCNEKRIILVEINTSIFKYKDKVVRMTTTKDNSKKK